MEDKEQEVGFSTRSTETLGDAFKGCFESEWNMAITVLPMSTSYILKLI